MQQGRDCPKGIKTGWMRRRLEGNGGQGQYGEGVGEDMEEAEGRGWGGKGTCGDAGDGRRRVKDEKMSGRGHREVGEGRGGLGWAGEVWKEAGGGEEGRRGRKLTRRVRDGRNILTLLYIGRLFRF